MLGFSGSWMHTNNFKSAYINKSNLGSLTDLFQKKMQGFSISDNVIIPVIGTGPGIPKVGCRWRWVDRFPVIGRVINALVTRINTRINQWIWCHNLANSLKIGYRLIDYSSAYGNEQLLKKSIRMSGVKREDIFIISRASNTDQYNHRVRESFLESLKKIGTDYLDLYMFHWPVTGYYVETWKVIEQLYKEGFVRSIGVCNCHQHHLETILHECEIKPMVNEFEVHPLFTQKSLISYCKGNGIHVIAYTPLARNDDRLRSNLILRGIAKNHGKSIYQVILRWDIQNGLTPIPRSSNKKRNRQNYNIFDFELSDDEMKAIDSININSRLRYDPDNLDFHSVG